MLNESQEAIRKFNDIIIRYYVPLVNYAKSITQNVDSAEDIVQDLFVDIWEKQIRFEPESTVRNFLYVSVNNRALNYLRSEKRLQERHQKLEIDNDNYTDCLIQEEVYRRLREAIDTLPKRSAQIMNLSIQGLSQQEIADKMGITINSVKTMKAYAIKKLKEILPPMLFLYIFVNYTNLN